MNREETNQNKNADTTCFILIHRNDGSSLRESRLRELRLVQRNLNSSGSLRRMVDYTDHKDGSSGLGSSGNKTPLFMSRVKGEMPKYLLECLTCGKIFTNRDDIDFHATSCQMIEDGVMNNPELARSDSRFILNTNEECDKSTSGTGENTVETSRSSLSFPNTMSTLSGLELDRERNGVVHNLSIECSEATTNNVATPVHVPHQTSYEIENIDGKVLGVVVDDKQVAEGIPLPAKENASSSTEKSKYLEIRLSKQLSWIRCQSCGTFLPTQAKLEHHIACRHYSPTIFDDTFDDRDQADEEKEAEGNDVQFVMAEEIFIQPDVRMTRWFQCETCCEFFFSEDDLLRHLCRSNPKGQDSRSLEDTDEDYWIGALNFGVGKDELIRETENDADQNLIDKDILNDPYDFDLDKTEEENYAERSDTQFLSLSKSRPGQTTQKSQKTNANYLNRKTRGKRGISSLQKETCDSISRKSERLQRRLGGEPQKGQISVSLVRQESNSKNINPLLLKPKSPRRKRVLLSKQNEGNPYDYEKDDTDVVEKRSSSHYEQIRESRSDSSTSINIKSRESRSRKSKKGVNMVSLKIENEKNSLASTRTRPNEKYKHQCTVCFKWFQNTGNIRTHMRSHTGEKPFQCDICLRQFSQKTHFKNHQNVHSGIKPFECDICHRQFSQKVFLKKHRELHTRVLPLKCRFCPMRFGHQHHLNPHERRHLGPQTFKCDQCSATFSSKGTLKRHQFFHTGQRPFKCNICNQAFQLKFILRNHEKIHSDHRPFKCSSCPKVFRTKPELRSHELTHLTERPFKCDLCPKSYVRKRELDEHKCVHTGERPHKCDVCSKMFRLKSQLTVHKTEHSATAEFKCDVCSKTFKVKKYLRAHKNVHISTELFKCDVCSKTFKLKTYLDVHKLIHSYQYPYKCDICDNIFMSASVLHYHRRKGCVRDEKVKFEEPISSSSSTM